MRTRSRSTDISRLFGGGTSQLLNGIARLSVLYEDFRVEHEALAKMAKMVRDDVHRYRLFYFIRRSIATMNEFQAGLTYLAQMPDFKAARPSLSVVNRKCFDDAKRYLAKSHGLIKAWRDNLGGHFPHAAAEAACRNLPPGSVGTVRWNRGEGVVLGLELAYAEHLIVAAMGKQLPGVHDAQKEMSEALETIMDAYLHIQKATYALVNHFLWPKFG
jgi:hypothetical protein